MNTKIYISGKISGLESDVCKYNFANAKFLSFCMIKNVSFDDIIIPLEIKPFLKIYRYWFHIIADIWQLLFCSHVAFQKNWVDSTGARIEMIVALITNKKIIML